MNEGFLYFTAAACRNGATMTVSYEVMDQLDKARAEKKAFILL